LYIDVLASIRRTKHCCRSKSGQIRTCSIWSDPNTSLPLTTLNGLLKEILQGVPGTSIIVTWIRARVSTAWRSTLTCKTCEKILHCENSRVFLPISLNFNKFPVKLRYNFAKNHENYQKLAKKFHEMYNKTYIQTVVYSEYRISFFAGMHFFNPVKNDLNLLLDFYPPCIRQDWYIFLVGFDYPITVNRWGKITWGIFLWCCLLV
jgi:hypothetical protein